jgi:hypothetical protein
VTTFEVLLPRARSRGVKVAVKRFSVTGLLEKEALSGGSTDDVEAQWGEELVDGTARTGTERRPVVVEDH